MRYDSFPAVVMAGVAIAVMLWLTDDNIYVACFVSFLAGALIEQYYPSRGDAPT